MEDRRDSPPAAPRNHPRLARRARFAFKRRAKEAVRGGFPPAALLLAALLPLACGKADPASPADGEGPMALDTEIVIDDFAFSSAACAEVAPSGSEPADTAGPPVARLVVTSTACYAVTAGIEDSLGAPVRTLRARFAIANRRDGDKDRGAVGYLAWDGRDAGGTPAPPGEYLWRLAFDFGSGRALRWRALTAIGGP